MKELLLITLLLFQDPAAAPLKNSINGSLVYSDGTPIAGTLVRATGIPGPDQDPDEVSRHIGFANDAGVFRIISLRPGRYRISIGGGEMSFFHPGVATEANATVVTISAEANLDGVNIVVPRPRGFSVSGRVTPPPPPNRQATPGRQAPRVELTGGRVYGRIIAPLAADGTFEFSNVSPGSYLLNVAPALGTEERGISIIDRNLRDVDFAVPQPTLISGTVSVDARAALPRLSLWFDGSGDRVIAPVSPDGTFTAQILEGEHRVLLSPLPAGLYVKSLTTDSADLVTNNLKVNPPDPKATPIRIKAVLGASPPVRVSGRVKDGTEPTEPKSRTIAFTAAALDETFDSPVSGDGSFEVSRVRPGAYYVRVATEGEPASAPTLINVPNTELRDLQVSIPGPKEVFGRIAVEGNGPPPKFSVLLLRGPGARVNAGSRGGLPTIDGPLKGLLNGDHVPNVLALEVEIDPLEDGSFKIKLAEGEYRVALAPHNYFTTGIPDAYFIRSLRYGAADLLSEPLKITADESAELNFGFGTTAPNPWVKVSGRVVGAALITGPARVALESEVTATMEAFINPDGTFEFPRVLPDTDYVARMTPESILSSAPKVNVAAKDITGLEVVIAREREVKGRASVENGGTVPAFLLSLRNAAGSRRITVKPDPSGAFTIKLPEDERNVDIVGLSIAYTTKSFTYGSTNLLKKPLKIASESSTMDIVFGIGDTLLANVRGRVTGLDADSRARLTLRGISDVSSFETALDANGAFSFTKIPTGTYAPSLTEDGPSFGLMQPSIITVAGKDLLNVEITAPRQNGRKDAPRIEDIKTGARIRELGVNVGESSAVANLRTINTAEVTYLAVSGGNYGTIADLIDAGLLDETFKQTKAGFRFGIIATGSDYAAVAVPASSSSGRYGYYSVPDAVVRYSLLDALSPRNEGGNPVR